MNRAFGNGPYRLTASGRSTVSTRMRAWIWNMAIDLLLHPVRRVNMRLYCPQSLVGSRALYIETSEGVQWDLDYEACELGGSSRPVYQQLVARRYAHG